MNAAKQYGQDLGKSLEAANAAGEQALAAHLARTAGQAAALGTPPTRAQQVQARNGLGRIQPLAKTRPLASLNPLIPETRPGPMGRIAGITGRQGDAQAVIAAGAIYTEQDLQAAVQAYKDAFTQSLQKAKIGDEQ